MVENQRQMLRPIWGLEHNFKEAGNGVGSKADSLRLGRGVSEEHGLPTPAGQRQRYSFQGRQEPGTGKPHEGCRSQATLLGPWATPL